MTSDLETMLRTSLHERAHDVEPTPELWRQVDRRISRRRALPLFAWTAAGVAAVVTAALVGPGLVDGVRDGPVIDPAQSPSAVESPGEAAPGPAAAAGLTHYVAVVDGRLVLRSVNGSEEELGWSEGGAPTLAVRPGSRPDRFWVATVAPVDGMLNFAVVTRTPSETSTTQTFLASETGDGSAMPTVAWSPEGDTVATLVVTDGRAELVLVDVEGGTPENGLPQQRIALAGVDDPSQLQVQDWSAVRADHRLLLTAGGRLLALDLKRTEAGWERGALRDAGGDDYVIDVATHPDGRLYRLLAGEGAGSGDAEDAGLGLFLDEEPLGYPDLPTSDPSGVWMTAVDGGVFVGLGNDTRQVLIGEGGATMTAVRDTSYAAWIPVAGTDAGPAPTPSSDPTAEAPSTAGPPSASGVTPYVAIDEDGRLAVHTGDAGDREVILDEQLWDPEAAVSVLDVSVRPGSSAGEVSGVVLLATEGGPELAWFRAAAGETSTRRMEGPFGLGEGDTEQRDAPTFSPDGRHLAWVEPDGAGGWTLRTVGIDDNGPTGGDAGFGIDLRAERVHLADWQWHEVDDAAGTARGVVSLVDDAGRELGLQIERQGDGALATGDLIVVVSAHPPEGTVITHGTRGDETVSLVASVDGLLVRQPGGDVPVPVAGDVIGDDLGFDLDVLERVAVVTYRLTGEAYVVDLAGEVAPLDAGRPVHGFDPVR